MGDAETGLGTIERFNMLALRDMMVIQTHLNQTIFG